MCKGRGWHCKQNLERTLDMTFQVSLLLLLIITCSLVNAIFTQKRDSTTSYLPYMELDSSAVHLLPQTNTDTDICSDPIHVPGGLPLGSIRAMDISVCENGVILTEPELLKSSLCVCRGEFPTCPEPVDGIYAIAPFWSDINNISATENTTISYQIFTEDNGSHRAMLLNVSSYIASQVVLDSIQFFPKWMLVSHWRNVHPYVQPNEVDPRRNTFEAIVATDGTQTYTIFTYNCSDLTWARTPNSFIASGCSFIGVYTGGSFEDFQAETVQYGLQTDHRTANISRAASCSRQQGGTSWNNFLFILTPQRVVNITAREEMIGGNIGDSATMQFSISTFIIQSLTIEFLFTSECQCTEPVTSFAFSCNSINHNVMMGSVLIDIICSMARINVTVLNVTEEAFGDYVISITSSETDDDVAYTSLVPIEEIMSNDLVDRTSDPATLTPDDIASATTDLQDIQTSALTNENVREDYLQTIDNLMQADGESIVQSQMETNSSSKIIDSLQEFTLSVELPENVTNETFIYESYGFQLFDIHPNTLDEVREIYADLGPLESVTNLTIPTNITFSSSAAMSGENVAVYVQVVDDGGSQAPFRMSVVAYRQVNLFQNDTSSNRTGVNIVSAVMSILSTASEETTTLILGFQTLVNDDDEEDDEYSEVCSDFNTGGNGGQGAWSGDNCERVQCDDGDSDYTCCECHTYGHFGLLLAVTPVVLDPELEVVLVVFSYIGAGVSILCLSILLITYTMAKKLRSTTNGRLIINLAMSLLAIYIFFIVSGHIRPYGDTQTIDIICATSSALLQYFMLVYFGWTAAEALNLYFSLVKVFEAKTIRHYTLKAGLIIWIIPLGVVAISAGVGHRYYINDVYCRPVEWPFYFAFILPIALILIFDCAMFTSIMISLYQHTKQTERLKNDQQTSLTIKQIKQNTRYAVVLVTLFGIGWTFGLIVTGYPEAPMAVTFTLQFIFCLFVSTQGFMLFLFQVVFSREAKDFWINLFARCFPSLKKYKISEAKKHKPAQMRKKTIMKKLTGIFRAPKYTDEMLMQLPMDTNTSSTMGRGGHSAITESFEASYQTSTLQRANKITAHSLSPNSLTSTTNRSMDNLITDIGSSDVSPYSEINFDNLSLQDDF